MMTSIIHWCELCHAVPRFSGFYLFSSKKRGGECEIVRWDREYEEITFFRCGDLTDQDYTQHISDIPLDAIWAELPDSPFEEEEED